MYILCFLLVICALVAAAPEMDKEATDKLVHTDPQKGVFCIGRGLNPYRYGPYSGYGPYGYRRYGYGPYGYYNPYYYGPYGYRRYGYGPYSYYG
uniref:Neuropeptide-like protein 31 n=1 Tax=Haemonchus contortus TaxID=6289 RepID=A0A7I4YJC0_HAECO